MLTWAIFDLDGTLAETAWRNHHAVARDWDRFHAGIPHDKPRPVETALLAAWKGASPLGRNRIAIVTGRPERYLRETIDWLDRHGIHFDALFMRQEGDLRSDVEVKREVLNCMIESNRGNIAFVVEDRDRVVEMWRTHGILCFQFQKGAY